jgi:hypothetical protein
LFVKVLAWQNEYGIVTFGGSNLDLVVKYIQNQRQYPSEGTLYKSLEKFDETEED